MKILTHHDPDGVVSALFVSYGEQITDVRFPEEFGDISEIEEGDFMLDMRPSENIAGFTCIDHHLDHPEKPKYKLIWDNVPTSLITWRLYKEEIPKSEWWKLAVGLVGDYSPELIPYEVFYECPALLRNIKTSSYYSYGDWKINTYPLYKLLSSPINALCKIHREKDAYLLLASSSDPYSLYHSELGIKAKEIISDEAKRIMNEMELEEYDNLVIASFVSDYRMTGHIASILQNGYYSNKTVMAINKKDGSLSLRGDLALYYKQLLSNLEYIELGGHAGAMGGKIRKHIDIFREDLDKLFRKF